MQFWFSEFRALVRIKIMSKITKSARGEDCSLRLGQCSSPETVILAHIGKSRGIGIKCGDYFAVYACSSCHDIIDGRVNSQYTKDELNTDKLRALEETQAKLFSKGLLNETR
jgi:hypothetical protein